MIKSAVFTLEDFSGGLNTRAGTMQLEPNQSPNCLNVHSNLFKSLQVRRGSVAITPTAVSELTGRGLYVYPFWSSNVLNEYIMAFFGDKLYKITDLAGTITNVAHATAQTDSQFSATVYSTATQNFFIYTNQGLNRLQSYNGITDAVSNLNDSVLTASKYVVAWKRHLWCLYTKESGVEHQFRLRRTDIGTYGSNATDWTDGVSGYDDIVTEDGDFGTAFGILRGFLYVFKRNSIFRVSYLGGSPLVEIRQISSIGTEAFQSISNITLLNGDEILSFLGTDNRIYIFNGYNAPQPISELISEDNGISQFSLPKVNKDVSHRAVGANFDRRHWYVVFLPFGTSMENNGGYIIDYYTQPFSIFPFDGWKGSGATIFTDADGERNLYFQGYDGKTKQAYIGDSDEGAAINSYYETSRIKVDKSAIMKKTQQAQLLYRAIGNYDYSFGYRHNYNTSYKNTNINQQGSGFVLGTSVLGTGLLGGSDSRIDVVDIPRLFNFIQFLLMDNSTNPKMNLYQIELLADAEGLGKV